MYFCTGDKRLFDLGVGEEVQMPITIPHLLYNMLVKKQEKETKERREKGEGRGEGRRGKRKGDNLVSELIRNGTQAGGEEGEGGRDDAQLSCTRPRWYTLDIYLKSIY